MSDRFVSHGFLLIAIACSAWDCSDSRLDKVGHAWIFWTFGLQRTCSADGSTHAVVLQQLDFWIHPCKDSMIVACGLQRGDHQLAWTGTAASRQGAAAYGRNCCAAAGPAGFLDPIYARTALHVDCSREALSCRDSAASVGHHSRLSRCMQFCFFGSCDIF